MSNLNQAMLIGFLGNDPQVLKETEKGKFVKMRLCTNKKFKNAKGDKVDRSTWHTVYVSNQPGNYAASYFKKGDLIFVSGELQSREWQDKEEVTRIETSVNAKECKLLSKEHRKSTDE